VAVGNKTYLLHAQQSTTVVHEVLCRESLEAFGCSSETDIETGVFTDADLFGINFTRSSIPIPMLKRKENSPDEVMRVELIKIASLQENLLENITNLGKLINPAVVPWRGRLLLAMGRSWGVGNYQENDNIEFMWLNQTSAYNFHGGLQDMYLGIGNDLGPLNVPQFMGQDPRLLKISESKVMIAFTNRFVSPVSMGIAFLELNETRHIFVAKVFYKLTTDHDRASSQKNWSPFLYNNTVMFIQSINPLRVMYAKIQDYTVSDNVVNFDSIHATTFSVQPHVHVKWSYGHIRGGSNALPIDNDRYLALFHSSLNLPFNGMRTYFMGAYTFSSRPPFRLLSISTVPILHERFYTGPWALMKKRNLDYVVFPVSIFFNDNRVNADSPKSDGDKNTLFLTFGHNDEYGFLATLPLDRLLDSMAPVHSS